MGFRFLGDPIDLFIFKKAKREGFKIIFQRKFWNKDDVLKTLSTLDYFCKQNNVTADLVMLGGSAILTLMEINGESFRPTLDVDVNIINVSDMSIFTEQLKKVNVEIVGGVMEVPPMEDFENQDFLYEVDAGFEAIRVYLPNIELLACSKIFSTREKDLYDLKDTKLLEKCDKEYLMSLVEEYKQYLLNPANPDLNVHQLDRIFKEKGI